MHQGCVRWRQRRRGGGAGWWPTSPSSRLVGREYYTRELATDHEQYLSGHGESPGRWYGADASSLGLQGEASVAGFQAMFEGRHPDTGGSSAAPTVGARCRPSMWCCARPRASRSSTAWAIRPPDEPCWRPIMLAWPRRSPTWTDTGRPPRPWRCPARVRPGVLAVGFDHRTSREGDPLLHTHLVVANRVQGPDGRWTALDGRDLYRHRLAADAIYRATYQRTLSRTLGVEWTPADAHGNRELQGMPEALVRGSPARRPDRCRARSAGCGWSGADAAAGQMDCPSHPQT